MGIITFSRKAAAVLLVYVAGAGSASAAPVVGTVFDNWAIECELPPGGKEKKCFITQFVMANKEGEAPKRLMKLSIGHLGPKGEMVVVAVLPLGISIPTGAAFKIDDRAPVPMVIQSCVPDGCVATALFDAPSIEAIQTANGMVVGALPLGGSRTMNIPLSLKGVKPALFSLE